MNESENTAAPKVYPRGSSEPGVPGMQQKLSVGIGISYYGPASPAHRDAIRSFKDSIVETDDFRIQELHGSAYPEMAYAELCREALSKNVDVLFLLGHRRSGFNVEQIRSMCERAFETGNIVGLYDLTFTAIPLSALAKMGAYEEGTYSNTGVLDTGFSEGKARPFASPWKQKTDGSVGVEPWSGLEPCGAEGLPSRLFRARGARGEYMTPEKALICRAMAAGVQVVSASLPSQEESKPSWSHRIHIGDAVKRAENGIAHNYAFCVPCFGGLDHHQQDALWNLEIAGCTTIELRDCPYIDQARSWLTKKALELGCDGVFFIDHDIIFIPRDALDMIEEAEQLQDVVSAVYCMRKTAHSLIGATHPEAGTEIGFFELGGLYRALYSGLGFSAIPKAVIHALDGKLPRLHSSYLDCELRPYYALDVNGTFYSGEDASFCARVQGLTVKMVPGSASPNGHDWEVDPAPEKAMTSHKVWLDTRVRIFHRGSYDYGIEDHSFAVPRYARLKGQLVGSRSEVKRFLTDTIGVDAVLRGMGLDDNATEPHAIIEEHPPCKCGHGHAKHVSPPEGTTASTWLPGWCSECSCAHYVPYVQYAGRGA